MIPKTVSQTNEQEFEDRRAQVADEALRLWCRGALAETHAFFDRFQLSIPDLRIYQGDLILDGERVDGHLMVRLQNAKGCIGNVAFIAADGQRRYLSPDHVTGLYFSFKGAKNVIVVSVGFVRGARVHKDLGHAVAVCFKSDNVTTLTSIMRQRHARAKILLATPKGGVGDVHAAPHILVEAPLATPLYTGRECAEFDNSALAANSRPANPPSPARPLRPLIASSNLAADEPDAEVITAVDNAKKLLVWVARRGLTEFARKVAMQRGPSGVRTAAVVGPALALLVEHGWLVTVDGRRYQVTPAALSALANRQ